MRWERKLLKISQETTVVIIIIIITMTAAPDEDQLKRLVISSPEQRIHLQTAEPDLLLLRHTWLSFTPTRPNVLPSCFRHFVALISGCWIKLKLVLSSSGQCDPLPAEVSAYFLLTRWRRRRCIVWWTFKPLKTFGRSQYGAGWAALGLIFTSTLKPNFHTTRESSSWSETAAQRLDQQQGSDIRGRCVSESDHCRLTRRYPNSDPLVFDMWPVSGLVFERRGSTVKRFKPQLLNLL